MNSRALQLLDELEELLKAHDAWSSQMPGPEQLNSQVPFAADSLLFGEWLQFIMLPQLRQLMNAGHALPAMAVAPAAEIYLPHELESGSAEIIVVLTELDALAPTS